MIEQSLIFLQIIIIDIVIDLRMLFRSDDYVKGVIAHEIIEFSTKYNVWKEFDLLELGEITNKTAKKVYLKFKIDIPKRWCIIGVVDNPSEWKENAT